VLGRDVWLDLAREVDSALTRENPGFEVDADDAPSWRTSSPGYRTGWSVGVIGERVEATIDRKP
jgi:hypothetical protein